MKEFVEFITIYWPLFLAITLLIANGCNILFIMIGCIIHICVGYNKIAWTVILVLSILSTFGSRTMTSINKKKKDYDANDPDYE